MTSPWQDNCSTITSALTYMLNHEIIVDAIFKKGKVSCLFAHKLVLAMWSPKIADWIAETDKSQMFSITFEEDVDVLKIILQYLYSPDDLNCFAKLPIEKLIQALEISERYEVTHVYKKCLSVLRRKKINPANVFDYFDYGLRKNFNGIVQKCVKVLKNEGIKIELMKEDFSVSSLLNFLSLDKIAMKSEADLLNLVLSWLSYPDNKAYKSQVLSLIDLQSVNCEEYQEICKKFPLFFSDNELSAIILSNVRQNPKLLPQWYKPKIRTVVENKCSLCIHIHKKLEILKPLHFIKTDNHKDLKTLTQKFVFQFQRFPKVKVLNIEMGFGPKEIRSKEFALQVNLGRNVSVTKYVISTTKYKDKYKVIFKSPLALKPKDTLSLKFHFRKGLLANNIHVVWPIVEQQQEMHNIADAEEFTINLSSPEQAFVRTVELSDKFIVSSFYLNVCNNHGTILNRRRIDSGNIPDMEVDHEFKNLPDTIPFKADVKKQENDIKMEVDDVQENDVTMKDIKPFIKTEPISLDSSISEYQDYNGEANLKYLKLFTEKELISSYISTDNQHMSFQSASRNKVAPEIIDLTDYP